MLKPSFERRDVGVAPKALIFKDCWRVLVNGVLIIKVLDLQGRKVAWSSKALTTESGFPQRL